MPKSGGMGNTLKEACWAGGTVSSVSIIRLSSEQELGQHDLCVRDQCSRSLQ